MTTKELSIYLRINNDYIHRLISKSGEWFDLPRKIVTMTFIGKDGKKHGAKGYSFDKEEVYSYFEKKYN